MTALASKSATRRGAALVCWMVSAACAPQPTNSPVAVQVMLPVGGSADVSIGESLVAGLTFARSVSDFELELVAPSSSDEGAAVLDDWLADSERRRLVIVGSSLLAPAVEARDCDVGGAQVLQLDATVSTCRGVRSVQFQSFGPAFLAGVAAVSSPELNPSRSVGIIAGADIPPVRELTDGFTAGVAFAGGEVRRFELVSADPGEGFQDPGAARALAESMIGEVGVIYAAAGGSSAGVAEFLEGRFGEDADPPVFYVASDVDVSGRYGQSTLGSVVKRFDVVVRDAVLQAVVGSFTSGAVRVGFRDGLTELVFSPDRAVTVLSGDCSECDAFLPECYRGCETLEARVRAATPAALEAAARYYEDAE